MCDGVVIDAHILKEISAEIAHENGPLYDIICWIVKNCGLAVTPYIETHWKQKVSDNDRVFGLGLVIRY